MANVGSLTSVNPPLRGRVNCLLTIGLTGEGGLGLLNCAAQVAEYPAWKSVWPPFLELELRILLPGP